ncbi:MAG: MerR family transcriptional regulator [Caulobacterales bacterium]
MAKGPEAFRSISEAADELGVPQHVLRFWETKFSFIRPMKRAGGRRFYRPQDIVVLGELRRLLHDEGYTIKGVQKLHREHGIKRLVAERAAGGPAKADGAATTIPAAGGQLSSEARRRLTEALEGLEAAKARLDALLAQP